MKKSDVEFINKIDPYLEKEKFIKFVSQKNSFCNVIENGSEIIGYIFYKNYKESIKINRIVIDENFRSQGFGEKLIHKIKNKLNNKRKKIITHASDDNLQAHMFLKKCGFKANGIKKHNNTCFYRFVYF